VAQFGAFYTANRAELLAHANRVMKDSARAEEVTQEALIKFMLAAPELESEAHALSYLHRTIENLCIDIFRAEGRKPNLVVLDEAQAEVESKWQVNGDHAETISAAEDAAIIRQALALLSPAERAALVMWEMEGRSTSEIASELGIKESAVRHTVSRARASLRKVLATLVIDEKRGLTALDLLSTTYKKAAKLGEKSGRIALSLVLVFSAFLGFNNLTGEDFQTPITSISAPANEDATDPSNEVEAAAPAVVDEGSLTQDLAEAQSQMFVLTNQVMALRSSLASVGWSAIDAEGAPIGFTSNAGGNDFFEASFTNINIAPEDFIGVNASVFSVNHLDIPVRIAQQIEVANGKLLVSAQPVIQVGSDLVAPSLAEESQVQTKLADGSTLVTIWQTLTAEDASSTGIAQLTVKIKLSSDGKVLSESARIIPSLNGKQASI
jgi:RNA polymerase sigma factor (sigma-70 family)